ncbi:MAG: hypothetical protein AB1568_13940 [Thermodesulfobacteriota bacterium]
MKKRGKNKRVRLETGEKEAITLPAPPPGERAPLLLGWGLVAVHFLIFSRFFPNAQGWLGHDHAYNLPMLLDGYYWFLNNGLFAVPWFSPAFCGGVPLLANPATYFYSVPQFLTFVTDPLTSLRLTLLLFAAAGFWGTHLLLRRVFGCGRWSALLGGGLFLFNGLFAYRFIIGHLEFHGFMLVPLLAFLLLQEHGGQGRHWRRARNTVAAGLALAYMFLSGMAQLIVPSLFGIVLLALVRSLAGDEATPAPAVFAARLLLAGLLALCLCAAKLAAAFAFLSEFQRTGYLLPGVDSPGKLLLLLLRMTALGGAGLDSAGYLVNVQWQLGRHEFEYGLSVVPFLLIAIATAAKLPRLPQLLRAARRRGRPVVLAACLLVFALPIALNYYTPAWNQTLKSIPFVNVLSNYLRWFAIHLPLLVLLAALAVERTGFLRRNRKAVVLAGLALLLGQNIVADRSYYHAEEYDPAPILAAYAGAKERGAPPEIADIAVATDGYGRPALLLDRNDALAHGASQLLCYEPMFGFNLEFFPFQSLHPGPALSVENDLLNLKNPACYTYPDENRCRPGDHFTAAQRPAAERFLRYRPFPFAMSTTQRAANAINLAALAAVVLFGLALPWGLRSPSRTGEGSGSGI